MESIHKIAEPLERLARYATAAKQSRIEAGIEIEQVCPEAPPPIRPFVEWNLVLHDLSLWRLNTTLSWRAGAQLHKPSDPAGVSG
jgi:hypothetical protein